MKYNYFFEMPVYKTLRKFRITVMNQVKNYIPNQNTTLNNNQ